VKTLIPNISFTKESSFSPLSLEPQTLHLNGEECSSLKSMLNIAKDALLKLDPFVVIDCIRRLIL
jgi:hypothetical protein